MKLNSSHEIRITKYDLGFTLIELILYVALVSLMFSALIPFAWGIIEGGVKVGVEQEVYSQARYLSERIKKEIRDASSVSVCSPTELYLINPVAAESIRFCYASNSVSFNQGNPPAPCPGAAANKLHSIDTAVTAFACTDYTGTGTDNVQVSFTMSSNYASATRKEYSETLNIQLSGETRN